jgi:hypothetical protein
MTASAPSERGNTRGSSTNLGIHKLGQRTDELRRCIQRIGEERVIDVLADRVPEGGFEALLGG